MVITSAPWSSSSEGSSGHALIQVTIPLLKKLVDGDLEIAQRLSSNKLTPYLTGPECIPVWKRRLTQIEASPADAPWVTRLIKDNYTGALVGRAGFHGPPDERGMIEVGYSIDPEVRRKGHAKAALQILLDVARRNERVKVLRASVGSENVASRGLVDQLGFEVVGKQWDDEDGLEIVLELPVDGSVWPGTFRYH